MRIQFILTATCVYPSIRSLAFLLRDLGHEVHVLFEHKNQEDVDVPCEQAAWSAFDFRPIEAFKPDRIVIWNGHFPPIFAAYEHIRRRWVTRVIELAWLPQRGHVYLAETLAQRSVLGKVGYIPGATRRYQELLEELRARFAPRPVGDDLGDFVLVPAQLEHDTSFQFSPHFKTIDSFVGYLKHELPEAAIIVKNHPLEKDRRRDCPVYAGEARFVDLAAKATMVLGLNSTALLETLVLQKPVLAYAESPGRLGFLRPQRIQQLWHAARQGERLIDPDWMDFRAVVLALNQFPMDDPPRWAADKILDEHYFPNVPRSF